jgi:hypothetical protein
MIGDVEARARSFSMITDASQESDLRREIVTCPARMEAGALIIPGGNYSSVTHECDSATLLGAN